jgi:hypothetical protein
VEVSFSGFGDDLENIESGDVVQIEETARSSQQGASRISPAEAIGSGSSARETEAISVRRLPVLPTAVADQRWMKSLIATSYSSSGASYFTLYFVG